LLIHVDHAIRLRGIRDLRVEGRLLLRVKGGLPRHRSHAQVAELTVGLLRGLVFRLGVLLLVLRLLRGLRLGLGLLVLRVRLLFFSGRRRGTAALRRIRRGRAGVLLGSADGTEQPPEQENQHDDTGNGGDASATVDLGWQRWLGITGWALAPFGVAAPEAVS